ncbi:TPA: fimbrial protein [Proteus mirabilis]
MNKILLLIVFFSSIANANSSLDVNFHGVLTSNTCQLSSDSLEKEIVIDNLRWSYINENGSSSIKYFFLNIEKCSDTDLAKTISINWKSNNVTVIDGDDYIVTDGNTNILLGITSSDNKLIKLNKAMQFAQVERVGEIQKIKFGVFVRKPTDRDINIGDFISVVTFTVEYE